MADVHFGIAHGASGIALFFLYLHLATHDETWLNCGLRALQFDLSHSVQTRDGGLSWPYTLSTSQVAPLLPYWRHGSIGVGTVLLRYYKLLRSQQLKELLDRIHVDADRRFAVQAGRFYGLSGIGELALDFYDNTNDPRYLRAAGAIADSVMMFKLVREGGTAFPGDGLARISCDFGSGSAGIALFLARLIGRKQGGDFVVDMLLETPTVSEAGGEITLPVGT